MINAALRAELSQDIRRLATGRMTNDAFDERYYEIYESSDARSINEIATYCYGLYSSDLLFPIRPRGGYALDQKTKKTIARCVLFLRSGIEFEWPPLPDRPFRRCLPSLAYNLGFPAGAALTIIATMMAIFDSEPFALLVLGVGLPLAAVYFWLGFVRPTVSSDVWRRFTESGDYDCWPFLQRESFESACGRNHLSSR